MEQNKENNGEVIYLYLFMLRLFYSIKISVEQLEQIKKALKSTIDTSAERAIDKFDYEETFEPLSYKLIEVSEEIAEHVIAGKE